MKRWFACAVFGMLVASLGLAQDATLPATAPAAAAQAAAANAGSDADIKGAFPTMLLKGVDSKKLKEGDTVVCQTIAALHSRSGLMIPSGSRVIGHVTQATARSKGSPDSTLIIAFDKIEVTKGKELAMKGTIQAIGQPVQDLGPNTGAAGSNVLMGHDGGAGTSPGTTPPPMASQPAMGNTARPVLIATSQGVLGVHNLELDANGVISSPGKEVRLDNGTQILIRAVINIPVQ